MLWFVVKAGEGTTRLNINESDIVINPEVKERKEQQESSSGSGSQGAEGNVSEVKTKGYRNIALFGVDSTTGALSKNTRSDVIMIASVNQDTGDVKLCSLYRDTYLNRGNDTYNKCNSAYATGGPEQAINMLNMNLDLDITDFVTVGFAGLTRAIDALGGVEIDVDSAERPHLNNYQYTMAEDMKTTYKEVTKTGLQNLNGLQATAYCRIRYTAGDDYKRAERQREVLKATMDKAKKADPATLTKTANAIFNDKIIYTSLGLEEILDILSQISEYQIVADDGFPQADMRGSAKMGGSIGDAVIPRDLYSNVVWLHEFLFDEANYQPSSEVQKYSDKIKADSSRYF
ncbi:MAG: LCP family protein [Lachnospiraceae bacterium]|nr:LCP family protein [Lachnospiraceae bacterium]